MNFKINYNPFQNTNIDNKERKNLIPFLLFLIKRMLEKRFPNDYSKRNSIRVYENRITFSCPYCGDSNRFKSAAHQRGNIFLNNMRYKCFNGGCGTSTNLYKLFSDFIELSEDEKIKLYDINAQYKNCVDNNNYIFTDVSKLLSKDLVSENTFNLITSFKIEDFKKYFDYENATDNKNSLKYLENRKIPKKYFDEILFDKKINCLIIPNLFKEDNEKFVISYITRTINKNSNFRYTSHKFKEIFEKIKETELPEELESINNFSIFFNLFNINLNEEIITCEGYFDSMFLPNCFSMSGIKDNVPLEDINFLFDNDETGIKFALKEMKKNKKVFLWKKFISENQLQNNFKDINELVIKYGENSLNNIIDYFSNEPLDIIFI